MKKQDVAGLVIYLIMFAIAIVYGLTVLRTHAAESSIKGWFYALFILGALVAGILLNATLLEVGHILGAKVGGYNILSVTILGLCFYKKEKGIGFKFSKFNGLTGETVITPKENGKNNPRAYLSFGNLFITLFIIAFIVLFFVYNGLAVNNKPMYDYAYFFLTVAVISALILIYNVTPIELDTVNDGYRLRLISNPKNKEALNELLKVDYELSKGNKDVEIKTFSEITNFTASLNLNKVYQFLEKKQIKEAEEIIDTILNGKEELSSSIYLWVKSLRIALTILNKPLEEAEEFYQKEVGPQESRALSEDKGSLSSIRAYILIAGLFDKSKSECEYTLAYAQNAYKKVAKQRKEIEKELFNLSIDKITSIHPRWNLDDYKLN